MSFDRWLTRFALDVHRVGEFLMLILVTLFLIGITALPGLMLLWAVIYLLKQI